MSAIASAALKARIHRPSLLKKFCQPEDLLHHFPNGAYIGWSGFTGVGYPKKIPTFLADHVEKNGLQGKLKYTLFVGASSGAETENRWAALDMIERRSPHQVGKNIAKGINEGRIKFFDKHLSMFPSDLVYVRGTCSCPRASMDAILIVFFVRVSIPRTGRPTSSMSPSSRRPRSRRTVALFPVLPSVLHPSCCSWPTRSSSRSTLRCPSWTVCTILS